MDNRISSYEDEILVLEEKENDLVISQVTLQTNVHSKIDSILHNKTQVSKKVTFCNCNWVNFLLICKSNHLKYKITNVKSKLFYKKFLITVII